MNSLKLLILNLVYSLSLLFSGIYAFKNNVIRKSDLLKVGGKNLHMAMGQVPLGLRTLNYYLNLCNILLIILI